MAEGRDARDPAGGTAAEAPLPSPERLSIYTFRSRYHALNLPLWIGLIAVVLVLLHILLMHLFHKYDHLPKSDPDRIRWQALRYEAAKLFVRAKATNCS